MGKDNKDNKNRKGFKLPEDVKDMAKITLKKFKKDSDGIYDGKKELRKAYYSALLDYLPETIALLTRYGNIGEVQAIQDDLYAKLTDPQFIKVIKHCIEDDEKIKDILEHAHHYKNGETYLPAEADDNPNLVDDVDVYYQNLIVKYKIK